MTDQSPQARIRQLEIENERLQDEIHVLKSALVETTPLPSEWRLTPTQTAIMRTLLKREFASKEALMAVLYSDRAAPPDETIIGVLIHRMRGKLEPHGIEIRNIWGVGYAVDTETRMKLRKAA